jgi:hypothetical protein
MLGRRDAECLALREEAGDWDVVRHDFADERVVHQREMHRPARLRPHGGQRMAKPVVQVLAVGDGFGQAGQRRHHRGVVEGRLACVLERAASLHVDGHFAGEHQHRRAVGFGRGNGRCHIAGARSADAERRAEGAAGAGVAVGHVGGTALLRRDDRLEFRLTCERRQERIDQAAGNQEQVTQAFGDECVENVIGPEGGGHGENGCSCSRASARMECAALLARQRRRDKRPGLPNAARFAIALPASGAYLPDIGCGCSSGVEHNLAKVGVEGSNPFARSKIFKTVRCRAARIRE